MTRVVVKELIFDVVNIEHIKKHNVSSEEAIKAGLYASYHKKAKKGRYLVVGRVEKRIISIVVNRKGRGRYYLVTARDADRKERKRVYEKEKKQNS